MRERRRATRVLDASYAVADDGTVMISLGRLENTRDVRRLLAAAARLRGTFWIGVVVTSRERDRILAGLHDGAVDAASHVVGARRKRARPTRGA